MKGGGGVAPYIISSWHQLEVNGRSDAPTNVASGYNPGAYLIGCWVGPSAGLDTMVKGKISVPAGIRTLVI
jgi:hypothetical protein